MSLVATTPPSLPSPIHSSSRVRATDTYVSQSSIVLPHHCQPCAALPCAFCSSLFLSFSLFHYFFLSHEKKRTTTTDGNRITISIEGSLRPDEHVKSLYRNFIEIGGKDNIHIFLDLNNNEKIFKEGTYSIPANKYSNAKTGKCYNVNIEVSTFSKEKKVNKKESD